MSVTNVTVNLDVTVDATGNISVFGQAPSVMENVIVANTQLPVTNFYKNSDDSLIRFQGATINGTETILGFLDQNFTGTSESSSNDLKQVLNGTFNCANATPFADYPTNDYKTQNSFGDLSLASYAHSLFGHVAATAAISNDTELISKMNGDGVNDAQLNIKLANAIRSLSNDKCGAIARQIIGQDASRAHNYDNDSNTPNLTQALEFRGGDIIYVSIRLQEPTVSVSNNVANAPAANKYKETVYVIKITLSSLYSAPSIVYTPDTLTFTQGTALTKTYYPINNGGRPDSFSISPALPAGLVINSKTGGISGTPIISSPNTLYVVTAASSTPSSTFLTIKVDPSAPIITYPTPQSFNIGASITDLVPTNTGGYVASYSAPLLPSGLSINAATGVISGTPNAITAANDYSITATNSTGVSTFNISMAVEASTPNISYTSPVTFTQGLAITPLTPTNTGGSVTSYSATLPAGLSINSTTGVISGTPTDVFAATNFVITANNATSSSTFTINMTSRIPIPSISYSTPDTYVVGTAITPDIPTNTGGAGTYTSDSLPAGLSVNSVTGAITGTPTAVTANGFYTIRATNSTGVGTTQVEIAVNPVAPNFSYPASPVSTNNNIAITPLVPETNGIPVTSWSVSPALPTGLSINNITGEISGTPSQEVTGGVYVITGTNVTGSTTANVTLTINRFVAQAPNITYASPHQFTNGTAITALTPTNTGGDVQVGGYSVSPNLPHGLSLNQNTGVISGTPTHTDMTSRGYTVSATNSYGTGSYPIFMSVYPALPNLQYESPFIFIDGSSSRNLTPYNAGGPTTSITISPTLPPNLVIDAGNGNIYGQASGIIAAANYTVTATNESGSTTSIVNIRINPLNPGFDYNGILYNVTAGVPITPIQPNVRQGPISSFALGPGIVLPYGLIIDPVTGIVSGTPTLDAVGMSNFYDVVGTNVAGSFTSGVGLNVRPPPPSIAYTSPSTAVSGSYYSLTPVNNGGPISSWSIDKSLPSGLNWNGTNGTIAGYANAETPADDYVITANNISGSSTFTLRLSVGPPLPTLSYTSPNVYKVGDAVTLAPTSSQSGVTYAAASLPAGMAIFTNTGVITGTPSEVKSARLYTVTATNVSGTSTFDVSITVNPALPVISYGSPLTYYNGVQFAPETPTSTGGAVDTYSGTLPAGLSLNASTGVITGTPSAVAAAADYIITATNSSGSGTATVNITVADIYVAPPVFSYPGSPFTFTQYTSVSVMPNNVGGPVIEWTDLWALPGSLILNRTTGQITGEAMEIVNNGTYDIRANNVNGSATTRITITIAVAPPAISYTSPLSFYMNNDVNYITPSNSGGAATFSITPALPPGLNFNDTNGQITGASTTQMAATNYTITATNDSGSSTSTLNLAFTRFDGVGSFKWATAFQPDTSNVLVTGLTIDSAKNVYTGGHYIANTIAGFMNSNISSFSNNILPVGAQLSGCNAQVAYVTKTNNNGQLEYALSMYSGGAKCNASTMNALAVDSGDNLYMTGRFGLAGTSLIYGSNMMLSNSNILNSWGSGTLGDVYSSYVMKFNTIGELTLKYGLGLRSNVGGVFVEGTGIKVDNTNHVINVGNYKYSVLNTLYNFEANGTTASAAHLPTTGSAIGSYIRKNNSSTGVIVWSAAIASTIATGSNGINGVALDSANNIYVVGTYFGTTDRVTFYSSNVTSCNVNNINKIRSQSTNPAAFVAKYNTNGGFISVASFNASSIAHGSGIAIDSADNVYITGYYSGTSNGSFISSSNQAFSNCNYLPSISTGTGQYLIKFNTNLHAQWATAIQTNTQATSMGAQGVVVDSANNIYITGGIVATPTAFNTRVFNSNQSSSNNNILPTTAQTFGGYAVKFNQNGTFIYATSLAGFNTQFSRTLATSGNELFFAGVYTGSSNAVVEYDSNFAKYYSSNIVPTPVPGTGRIATIKYQV
jgi:hypothetical protein